MLDFGLKPTSIWLEGRGAESLASVDLRRGDLLATVAGLRALGDSRRDIRAAIERIHDRGAAVYDIDTGLRSDQRGAEMLDDALARIKGERSMAGGARQARAMQAKSVASRIKGRMDQREALVFWRDPLLTVGQAVAEMTGWSAETAYRVLGKRGVPAGRRGPGYAREVIIAKHKVSEKGTIYFCRAANGRGPVKIGYSRNAEFRVKEMQTGHHATLTLIALIEGTQADERALHKRFAKYRERGEWFRVEGALKSYLAKLPKLPEAK